MSQWMMARAGSDENISFTTNIMNWTTKDKHRVSLNLLLTNISEKAEGRWPVMTRLWGAYCTKTKNQNSVQRLIQSTPDNSNLQGKSKNVWVIGS